MTVVNLPVMPPLAPMLAKAVPEIPATGHYEPKWDGFRTVVFRDGDEVELTSRNERSLTRYFPELVAALRRELPSRCVLDGEIVIVGAGGLDFEALLQRVHPAESRVRLLAARTPASFVAFDVLAEGEENLMARPFAERRRRLEALLRGASAPVFLTPATEDLEVAREWFALFEGAGLDGVVAKPPGEAYRPDVRAMFKVKHQRTADCVVAGYRLHSSGADAVGSLLLGLYESSRPDARLASVGVVGALPMTLRRALLAELAPLVTAGEHPWLDPAQAPPAEPAEPAVAARTPRSAEASRWNRGKGLSFVAVRPERVLEVRYDAMEGSRFRHTAQFNRWRPDRNPRSCTFEQLERPARFRVEDVLRPPES